MHSTNEDILLNKARDGDVAAFEDLMSTHYKKVYNICYRMVNNPEDASELAQETFLKVYRHIADFKGNSSISTWLYRIASNVCLDFLRKNKKYQTVSMEKEAFEDLQIKDMISSVEEGPEKIVESNAKKAAIKEALSKMNEHNRNAVILRDFMNLSYEEMSNTLNLPIGTVKSRISRARNELRALLCSGEEHLFTDYVKKDRREG